MTVRFLRSLYNSAPVLAPWLPARNYSSAAAVVPKTAKVELECETDRAISNDQLKPRFHPGRIKCSDAQIPPEIRTSIEKSTAQYPIKALIQEGVKISNFIHSRPLFIPTVNHTTGEDANPRKPHRYTVFDDYVSKAYLIGRSDGEYAVLKKIFTEITLRDPDFKPRSFLDFGAGVGTGSWAASHFWKQCLFEYVLVDRSRHMNDLAELLLRQGDLNKSITLQNVYFRQFFPADTSRKFDLVLSAFSLFDVVTDGKLQEVVDRLWRMSDGYLVFVEHGSNAGFQLINEVRKHIVKRTVDTGERYIFSPCPHSQDCPRIAAMDGTPCNFEITYTRRQPAKGETRETMRYSYVVFRKLPADSLHNYPRIVRPVLVRSKHSVCRMCTPDGKLKEITFTASKHGKNLYRCARASQWSDILPITITEQEKVQEE